MPGVYDWLLNALKSDQSPATNQLPAPIQSSKLTGLPVPFQAMPSESAAYNPLEKPMASLTGNYLDSNVVQDAGNRPPNDPLRVFMIRKYFYNQGNGALKNSMPMAMQPNNGDYS